MIRSTLAALAAVMTLSVAAAQQPAASAAAQAQQGPGELIEEKAQMMLDELNKNRAAYKKDPAKVRGATLIEPPVETGGGVK